MCVQCSVSVTPKAAIIVLVSSFSLPLQRSPPIMCSPKVPMLLITRDSWTDLRIIPVSLAPHFTLYISSALYRSLISSKFTLSIYVVYLFCFHFQQRLVRLIVYMHTRSFHISPSLSHAHVALIITYDYLGLACVTTYRQI